LKITQAYEILSDPERRSLYDDYGTTNEPRQGGSGGGGGGGGFHRQSYDDFFRDFDGFESFFGGHSGGFKFNGGGREHNRKSHEDEITKKIYDEVVLPHSYIKPYMIFSYTEFCFSCMSVDNVWQSFKQELKNIGFGAGHSDASWNRELAKVLGINTVPSICGIL
jgi:DnaJ homolog subfamily C member 16